MEGRVSFWKGRKTGVSKKTSLNVEENNNSTGLYPSTFADPRFRNEDSVFVTHECSSGGQEGNSASNSARILVSYHSIQLFFAI